VIAPAERRADLVRQPGPLSLLGCSRVSRYCGKHSRPPIQNAFVLGNRNAFRFVAVAIQSWRAIMGLSP
jgi:hypothetical protein